MIPKGILLTHLVIDGVSKSYPIWFGAYIQKIYIALKDGNVPRQVLRLVIWHDGSNRSSTMWYSKKDENRNNLGRKHTNTPTEL